MKNILLVINLVLLGLVGYLYFLHFSNNSNETVSIENTNSDEKIAENAKARIAYINLDSLQEHYVYYEKIETDFEKKQKDANNEIVRLQKKYQNRTAELQNKAATMTMQEQENAMQEINKMQQDFQAERQSIDNELYEYNTKMKEDILNRLQNFLLDYNKDGRYSYIFSYEPGLMFYKDSTLDITLDVIAGLNARYAKEQKK